MHRLSPIVLFTLLLLPTALFAGEGAATAAPPLVEPQLAPPVAGPDLDLRAARVEHHEELDLLVFTLEVAGRAGGTVPTARGQLDGAPVLGYVFPTTLEPRDVGFLRGEGTVALAVTSHPDFDDTPLWDEDGDLAYDDDGAVFHPHWVVLVPDARVAGGLAVAEIAKAEIAEALPPTHPGMPMLMDSPGFSVVLRGSTLRVLVPAFRVRGATDFRFDAVAAYMEVGPGAERPMLGVYQVYEVLSGDLSLPYAVESKH